MGRWHRRFTHVPLSVVTGQQKRINPDGALWLSVLESTGQPRLCNAPSIISSVLTEPPPAR